MRRVFKFIVGLVTVILFVPSWPTVETSAQDIPDVIINELAWAGSSASWQDEWIELKNTTSNPIDLTGWQITKDTSGDGTDEAWIITIEEKGDPEKPETCPLPHTIPAGGYFLIAHNDEKHIFYKEKENEAESVLNVKPDCIKKGISLSNDKLLIKLYDGQWDDGGELIDSAGDGKTPPPKDNGKDIKISMERNSDLAGWHSAVSATNLDVGVLDLATPKAINSEPADPPQLTSVVPNEAEVGGILEIEEIIGANFSWKSACTLQMIRNDQIIDGTNVNVVSETLIDYVLFDITNIELGLWDIKITNSDGQSDVLDNAIQIVEKQPTYDLSSTIRINEIYPRPSTISNDEFIELYNFGDRTVNLAGWKIDDIQNGGSSPHTINQMIGPEDYLILYKTQSKITLNDTGDSVFLIQPTGFILDTINYTNAKRGESFAKFNSGYKWTETPTPNSPNVLTETQPEPEDEPEIDEPEEEDKPDNDLPDVSAFNTGDILITELLPNPADGDEFIELYNPTDGAIDLSQWKLQDAGGKTYTIDDFELSIQSTNNTIIEPSQYIVIVQSISNIYLNNNGGESLALLDPSGYEIDFVSYPDKALPNVAYVLMDDGGWTWANPPTPGKPNVVILEDEDEPTVTAPLADLPPSGPFTRMWLGIILVSFAGTAIVFWMRENKHTYGDSHYHYRLT